MSQTTALDTTQRSDGGAGTPQRLTTLRRAVGFGVNVEHAQRSEHE